MPPLRSISLLVVTFCSVVLPAARADGLADDDLWRYRSSRVALDAGIVAAHPVALETGLATGVGAGITFGHGWTWGARASWTRATETAIDWTVTHDDLRAAVVGGGQVSAGRGDLGLRLGLGGAGVRERRERIHGDVAGSQGRARSDRRMTWAPAADLDAVVALHISGAWMMVLSGGPSLAYIDRAVHMGWMSQLGAAWQL